ncbi:proline dehydrogenase [Coemansia sp. IMI 209128]|nr:proline dehydrogenase [Coemansia sp. RSA 2530]KAJ2702187.1 proline dehydrogenase [Coemansia sp. IMI 209128]
MLAGTRAGALKLYSPSLGRISATTRLARALHTLPEGASEGLLRPDARLALSRLSAGQLATAWAVYRCCGSTGLVRAAPGLLRGLEQARLGWLSGAVVRRTFFAWFCAGETEREIVQTMRRLQGAGIGAILDYSAEADLGSGNDTRAQANVRADALAKEYLHSVHMAAQGHGAFVAVKVTGLADPGVLFRMSDGSADADDAADFERLLARARAVVQAAESHGVRVMIDAEHSYFQPAIDQVAGVLQREANTSRAVVFNTYQMYRVDALQRMRDDYAKARREGWRFGAKLVRGAYMELERERAAEQGYASPIHATLSDTHAAYDAATAFLVDEIASQAAALQPAVFVATHNNVSIERVLQQLQRLGFDAGDAVMFGQLLGMQDATSYALAALGSPVYKYVPYGPLHEVMPYLVRRAQENSAVATSIRAEATHAATELRRRVSERLLPRKPAPAV